MARFFWHGGLGIQAGGTLPNPFDWFGGIFYINLDDRPDRRQALRLQLSQLGIEKKCSRFPAIKTPDNHHVGCALSHRALIAESRRRELKTVLVLEDDVLFHRKTILLLQNMLKELETVEWDLFYFGGHTWGEEKARIPGCKSLRTPLAITTTHAIAYNHTAFDRFLDVLPETHDQMKLWLDRWKGFDRYLNKSSFRKVVADPMIAMQEELFHQPNPPRRRDFL
ncbi:MAG: glycosyltransferase family 25 protein [Mesorhizobium sp.]|nr:glycosyltransferase family 25 protein [Mesorhizobium sp.]MBL8577432.1 glycosyltransferase family 25 protein [Mesorhizobium sp.]